MRRIQAFGQGFYALSDHPGLLRITDLRMGPHPTLTFAVHAAQRQAGGVAQALVPAVTAGQRSDPAAGLPWLWQHIWGERLPSPD